MKSLLEEFYIPKWGNHHKRNVKIILEWLRGKSYKEICVAYGLSYSATREVVENLLHKLRRKYPEFNQCLTEEELKKAALPFFIDYQKFIEEEF